MHECETAGPGYNEQRDHRRFQDEAQQDGVTYTDQGAVGYFPAPDGSSDTLYADVHGTQMEYLQRMTRTVNQRPTAQRTPKCAPRATDEMQVQFEPTSMDETETVSKVNRSSSACSHDVWVEDGEINRRCYPVKIDTGARVNVFFYVTRIGYYFDQAQAKQHHTHKYMAGMENKPNPWKMEKTFVPDSIPYCSRETR
jgi:hypothetical protein